MMNKPYIKPILFLTGVFLMLSVSGNMFGQCDNLTLSLTRTNSTCLANGKIKVTVSGSDLPNIDQSTMQFQVSGAKDLAFSHYIDNTIENLHPGTYTISLRAFCNVTEDWIVATGTATTTITSSYKEMNFTLGRAIPTLNCKPTGIIPVVIESGTGTAPFTIEITSKPDSYTGATTFTISSRSDSIKNLPAGNYTFSVYDDCGYTVSDRTTTVGTMTQDYYNVFYQYFYPAGTTANACDLVSANRTYPSSGSDPDGYHYFYYNSGDYFEVAFVLNDTGTKNWQPLTSRSKINLTLPPPYTMKSMRDTDAYFAVYLRVKGCTTEHKLQNISLKKNVISYIRQILAGCDQVNLDFGLYSDYDGAICLPYEWRILNSDNTVFLDWQGPVFDRTTQTATNVPIGSIKMEFRDSEGYIWTNSITTSIPKPSLQSTSNIGYSNMEPDGVYKGYLYPYFYPSTFPVGTTFKFLSGPTPPTNLTGTLSSASSYIYPYSADIASSSQQRIEAGVYKFEVTRPGCTPDTITGNHYVYKLSSPPVYTLTEECDGLLVTFTGGGQMQMISYNGTVSNNGTPYVRIGSSSPTSLPFDNTKVVTHGGSLKLPLAGTYYIYLGTSNSNSFSVIYRDTIVYTPTPFTLDNTVTSHYLCQGESTGFIRVKGSGGAGGYKYELYDQGELKYTNTTGVFHYGTAGSTYTVKLYDTICGYSYPQDLTLIDLGIAQIAYSGKPDNKFCLSDSIYLKCLTLGETTYTWTGPGITAANQNTQNPAIAASDVGIGTHTYTITVTPEACGTEMQQTVSITVEDCSGAKDDYLTLLVNSTDSVDILANDAFPSNCTASPVISTGPVNGSYSLKNNKIVYTPNTDFTGKDSLTYSTACGASTTAKVYFTVLEYPDNISYENCYITPEGFQWDIKQDFESPASTNHAFVTPLAGDFDGDSIPDIITVSNNINRLNIYWGKDRTTTNVATSITLTTAVDIAWTNGEAISPYAVFKTKISGEDKAIVIVNDKHNLYAYDLNGPANQAGLHLWKTELPNSSLIRRSTVGIADFNNDGIPEVYVRNKIFNAHTGKLLVEGNVANNTGNIGYSYSARGSEYFTIAADVTDGPQLELIAGSEVYAVNITNTNDSLGNTITRVAKLNTTFDDGVTAINDGKTTVVDIDRDGKLDIVFEASSGKTRKVVAWNAESEELLFETPNFSYDNTGIPLIGNIDKNPDLEVSLIVNYVLFSYRPNPATKKFDLAYQLAISDRSGATGITLFDFNQDSVAEIVYRDESILRIMRAVPSTNGTIGSFQNLKTYPGGSGTWYEYPIVADVDNDGSGEIVVISGNGYVEYGSLRIYRSGNEYPWAPARRVWNQYAYNVVNVNNDLTIPKYQVNPATFFPGEDGISGTSDDIQPYNGFLMQQTALNIDGLPLWLVPDVYLDPSLVTNEVIGDLVTVTVGIINQGSAAIGSPVYVSLYKESIASGINMATDSANIQILSGDTGYVTVLIADITPYLPMLRMAVRINDNGTKFTYQAECDSSNNVMTIMNPALHLMMKKNATLEGVPDNGTYPNPVSVLYNEDIAYEITAVNANLNSGTEVIIRDTLPPYLDLVSASTPFTQSTVGSIPPRTALEWKVTGLASMATTSVTVTATPQTGSAASQPMFMNKAWITTSDTLLIPTNYTYHQGASVSIVTFSAGLGGSIYNAEEQALDYKTSPKSGIVVVPDEGYRFTGWSYEDYISLRGEMIRAKRGIMHYDTLSVLGNLQLHANFEMEEYPIRYYLHKSKNANQNPSVYTIGSENITLNAPEKPNDVFVGWTGSNGNKPQMIVNIPKGSTGERIFFANFLHSGRENNLPENELEKDKIWAAENELYIRTSQTGSIVRIYTTEGVLQEQHTLISNGITGIKLRQGIYIVTLNNGMGHKVIIH